MQAFFRLIRWKNLLFLAAIIWMLQRLVIVPLMLDYGFEPVDVLHGIPFVLLMLSIVLIAAGGYVINDYFDVKIDAINHPDSQIITKDFSREQAMRYYQVLTACGVVSGVVLAVILKSLTAGLIIVFVPGLLWFYSSSYKRMLVIGNLIVALSTALVPLMLAIANIADLENRFIADLLYQTPIVKMIYSWMGAFALFAFLMTFTREIIKDLEDQVGDRELECHTFPVVLGETWTRVIVMLFMLLNIGLQALAYFRWIPFDTGLGSANMNYALCFIVLWVVMIIMFLRSHRAADYAVSSMMMKILMGWGMVYAIIFYIQQCQNYGTIISLI